MGKRIVVVDDHPVIGEYLSGLLGKHGFEVVGQAATPDDAVGLLEREETEVAIVDISLQAERDGVDLVRTIRNRHPELRTLVYSMHDETSRHAVEAFLAGADGYLTKESTPAEVAAAVFEIASGGKAFGPRLLQEAQEQLGRREQKGDEERLAPREREVARLLAETPDVGHIAEKMGVGQATVYGYVKLAAQKLGLRGKRDLERWARNRYGEA